MRISELMAHLNTELHPHYRIAVPYWSRYATPIRLYYQPQPSAPKRFTAAWGMKHLRELVRALGFAERWVDHPDRHKIQTLWIVTTEMITP